MAFITTGPGVSQFHIHTMPQAIASSSIASSKTISRNEQTAEIDRSKLENSRQSDTISQEYETKKDRLEQKHDLKKQELESEYKQELQGLEQEYKQKQRTMGISLYI